MSSSISNQNQIATDFIENAVFGVDPNKMRAMVSKKFSAKSEWNYGKKVEWENIEQVIGAYKLAIWSSQFTKPKIEIIDKGKIKAIHNETPNRLDSKKAFKLDNIWTFTFVTEGEETKIDSYEIKCNVEGAGSKENGVTKGYTVPAVYKKEVEGPISKENELIIDYLYETYIGCNEDKMRAMVSKDFTGQAKWNYGKSVQWDNIDQVIGGFRLALWNNECSDLNIVIKDGEIKTAHKETANVPGSPVPVKLENRWAFTFVKEGKETKIKTCDVEVNVSKAKA